VGGQGGLGPRAPNFERAPATRRQKSELRMVES